MSKNAKHPSWFKLWLHHKAMIEAVPDEAVGKALKAALNTLSFFLPICNATRRLAVDYKKNREPPSLAVPGSIIRLEPGGMTTPHLLTLSGATAARSVL